jgi:hypothetical protein
MSFEVTCLFERYFTLQAFERFLYLFKYFGLRQAAEKPAGGWPPEGHIIITP